MLTFISILWWVASDTMSAWWILMWFALECILYSNGGPTEVVNLHNNYYDPDED